MFINIPTISELQWHPFTITSNSDSEAETLSVVIKCEGIWSSKLYQALSSPNSAIDAHLQASLEGPYGPVSPHFLHFDSLLLLCGGSGLTPFISILRHLFHTHNSGHKIPKILLVAAVKTRSDLALLHLLLPISAALPAGLDIQIEAYVTREKLESESKSKSHPNPDIRTVVFKPHPADSAAAALLGPNGWLWLAAIICSSFGIFLILTAVVTRFYIYPIDGNTNDVFNLALRSFLHILGMCVGIAVGGGGAVIWNRRRAAMEGRQIQSIEGLTPNGSPSPVGFYGEREVESLPYEALAKSVNVHYGERPNLARIVLECKGENIGVFASGPKKMRQEAAAICASGLAKNLHFQSISFTW